ncbi:hypothetical protein [Ideonella sp.]|uniref:hypothetical protein n=1 Tax=Ideonella sp. TaxID=1929293 RepID=UPI002B498B89|nr:hypothetical protein [Ideonella sp.]HJV69179.1 hypothetical protein [Ideonella sp.]
MPPQPPRKFRSTGLTRLEFAIAVVVIGVLVALALPRLAAPLVAARQVRLKMLLATAQSTASLFHGQCEVRSGPCERLPLRGRPVAGVFGWPAANADGIAAALKVWGGTDDIAWQPESLDGVPALRARLEPSSDAGTCEFIYAQAPSPGAAPRIALVGASCP